MTDHLTRRAGLAGKRTLVIGGAGGLGRACTEDLARAGARVAVCDKNQELLDDTVRTLDKEGIEVVTGLLDARDVDALTDFYGTVSSAFGGELDVLVNVVGGTFRQHFADSKPKGWDALIRTNFTWVLHAIHQAIPLMRAAGGGSIINLTSIEAHRAAPGHAVYAAMKHAVLGLTRTLAVELGPDQIRVNAIAADLTPTEGTAGLREGSGEAKAMRAQVVIPLGRYGTYEDIGGCALFLASDLSRYVTGSTLHPDGGTLASSGWLQWPEDGLFSHTPSPGVIEHMLAAEAARSDT